MADFEENDMCETEEEALHQRHRKEKKALQAEITRIKHSISKGDKKKLKEAKEKIATLEAELKEKHEKELEELKPADQEANEELSGRLEEMSLRREENGSADENSQPAKDTRQKKSKAQKRREKKAAESQAREERIKQQEIDNLTSSRHLEAVNIKALLAKRGLQIFEIPSDGNCLYAAVSHQLQQREVTSSVDSLRKQVADHMRENQVDFLPFLTKDNGDLFTSEDFEDYCVQLETTPAWGGQLEIQALSSILKVPIEVVQAEGPPLVSGDQFNQQPLILTYYRHAYGLGEHYHSVQILSKEETDEFS